MGRLKPRLKTHYTQKRKLMSKQEQQAVEVVEVVEVDETPDEILARETPADTPASEIPRFMWNVAMSHAALSEGRVFDQLHKDALYYLKREKQFVVEKYAVVPWEEEVARKVGLGLMPCPDCKGRRKVERNYFGQTTGIHTSMPDACRCLIYLGFYPKYMNPANVPTDYRNIDIHNLEKYAANFRTFNRAEAPKAFADLLDQVRKNPYSCFLLVGPAGTGKTTLMTAMYQRALQTWSYLSYVKRNPTEAVWKVDGPALSKQFREWEMRNREARDSEASVPPPEVTAAKILAAVRAGFVPCVFIDEIDKIKLDSDFQAKAFHDVITVAQANGGMVCASSNLGAQNLMKALGTQVGAAVVRRLCGSRLNPDTPDDPANGDRGGFLVNFWSGSCQKNYNFRAPVMEGLLPDTPFPPAAETASATTTAATGSEQGTAAATDPTQMATSGTTPAAKPKVTSGTVSSATHSPKKQVASPDFSQGGVVVFG